MKAKDTKTLGQQILSTIVSINPVISFVALPAVNFDEKTTIEISKVGIEHPPFLNTQDLDHCLAHQPVDTLPSNALSQKSLGVATRRQL